MFYWLHMETEKSAPGPTGKGVTPKTATELRLKAPQVINLGVYHSHEYCHVDQRFCVFESRQWRRRVWTHRPTPRGIL